MAMCRNAFCLCCCDVCFELSCVICYVSVRCGVVCAFSAICGCGLVVAVMPCYVLLDSCCALSCVMIVSLRPLRSVVCDVVVRAM